MLTAGWGTCSFFHRAEGPYHKPCPCAHNSLYLAHVAILNGRRQELVLPPLSRLRCQVSITTSDSVKSIRTLVPKELIVVRYSPGIFPPRLC
jgi:hypothetical protein